MGRERGGGGGDLGKGGKGEDGEGGTYHGDCHHGRVWDGYRADHVRAVGFWGEFDGEFGHVEAGEFIKA